MNTSGAPSRPHSTLQLGHTGLGHLQLGEVDAKEDACEADVPHEVVTRVSVRVSREEKVQEERQHGQGELLVDVAIIEDEYAGKYNLEDKMHALEEVRAWLACARETTITPSQQASIHCMPL